jgi:hypothetical protein
MFQAIPVGVHLQFLNKIQIDEYIIINNYKLYEK